MSLQCGSHGYCAYVNINCFRGTWSLTLAGGAIKSDGCSGKTSHIAVHDTSRASDRQLDGTHPQGSTVERHAWLPVKLEHALGHLEQGKEKCQQCHWSWVVRAGLARSGWPLSLASVGVYGQVILDTSGLGFPFPKQRLDHLTTRCPLALGRRGVCCEMWSSYSV